jgi:hypothetical protein
MVAQGVSPYKLVETDESKERQRKYVFLLSITSEGVSSGDGIMGERLIPSSIPDYEDLL